VLHILCEQSDIHLYVYTKQNDILTFNQIDSKMNDENTLLGSTRINPKTQQVEALHVCYHPEASTLLTLESLDTPSRVYSRIALQDAWSLHTKNPNNPVALDYLKRKGAVNLLASRPANKVALFAYDEPVLNVPQGLQSTPPALNQSSVSLFGGSLMRDAMMTGLCLAGIAAINALKN
jgi:hypothetical protein